MARVGLTIHVRLRRLPEPETPVRRLVSGAGKEDPGGNVRDSSLRRLAVGCQENVAAWLASTLRQLVLSAGKTLARVRRNGGPCGPTSFKIFRFSRQAAVGSGNCKASGFTLLRFVAPDSQSASGA